MAEDELPRAGRAVEEHRAHGPRPGAADPGDHALAIFRVPHPLADLVSAGRRLPARHPLRQIRGPLDHRLGRPAPGPLLSRRRIVELEHQAVGPRPGGRAAVRRLGLELGILVDVGRGPAGSVTERVEPWPVGDGRGLRARDHRLAAGHLGEEQARRRHAAGAAIVAHPGGAGMHFLAAG